MTDLLIIEAAMGNPVRSKQQQKALVTACEQLDRGEPFGGWAYQAAQTWENSRCKECDHLTPCGTDTCARCVHELDQRRQMRLVSRLQSNRPMRVLPDKRHGRRSTYNMGCRCDECTDEEARYSRLRKRVARGSLRVWGKWA